jgi:2-isopropylmalate synthase
MKEKIIIFDTTLRDGEQAPGATLNKKEKFLIAESLKDLGVDVIEAGFPVSSPDDFEAVRFIAKNISSSKVVICGLSRAIKRDIDVCWEAVKYAKNPRIHTFIATSDIHIKHKLNKTREEVLEMAREAVKYARRFTDNVEFSAEDAVRSEPEFLFKVIEEAIKAGATTINIPDTVGYSIPQEFGNLIKSIRENVPNIDKVVLSVHCHNDLGLAAANSLSAILNGARQVECTINGLGERAGNAALEEVVMALKVRKDIFKDFYTVIDTTKIYKTSYLVRSLTGIVVQPNKAIVGDNAFAHEAGIHQDGILKYKLTYEIMTPESVGVPESKLILGKHSGKHAFCRRLMDLGYRLPKKVIDRLFVKFKELADKKKYVYDEDLLSLVEEETHETSLELFTLDYLHTISGSKDILPTATVRLRKKKQVFQRAASGDGPVDAVYNAIDEITGIKPRLLDYVVQAVSMGKDAIGEASIKVEYQNSIYSGRGRSTDIIEASTKAYLDAINKIYLSKKLKKERIKEKL